MNVVFETAENIFQTADGQVGILTAGAALLGTLVGGVIQLSGNAIDRRIRKVEGIRSDVFTLASEFQRFASGLKQLLSEGRVGATPEDLAEIARVVETAYAEADRIAIKLIMSPDSQVSKQAAKIQAQIVDIFSKHGTISNPVTAEDAKLFDEHSEAAVENVFILMTMVGNRFRRIPEFRSIKSATKQRAKDGPNA